MKVASPDIFSTVDSVDREGRGIVRHEGKTAFVTGALPGELVEWRLTKQRRFYDLGNVSRIRMASASRVEARCRWFDRCGGCSMQHLSPNAQVAVKQRILEDAFWHIGRVRPEQILNPIHGIPWEYRHRARLSVRHVLKKGRVLVGFHEKQSSYVCDMDSCEVLPSAMSKMMPALGDLVGRLSIRDRVPQLEYAKADSSTAIVVRILASPSPNDEILLRDFAERHQIQIWLQPQGPASASLFWPKDSEPLRYVLGEFDVDIQFLPVDFTQVNHTVNRMMVRRAMAMLRPVPGERVLDLFCGLGNFTLPIARSGAHVMGVEGSASLLARAGENAQLNNLNDKCSFRKVNLFDASAVADLFSSAGIVQKVLIDPPRDGALEVVKLLKELKGVRRVIYVSCDPATLARDAGILVNVLGYRLKLAGIVNMFPHTSHVESIAAFDIA